MGILIKSMDEIPEDGAVLVVRHDNGKAYIKHARTYGYSMELVKLPAAQPATNCSEIPNGSDDTISRQAALDALAKFVPYAICDESTESYTNGLKDAYNLILQLPAAPSTDGWIPVERELPEDLAEVNVTWVNHEPEPYYEPIKSKPFTASAVYYEGKWYWYSSVCADVLAEYGRNDVDKVDDTIEITAWRPFPEPYRGGEQNDR